nr:MAG TPA: hypothetical protein [Caudoviricetes sp.]
MESFKIKEIILRNENGQVVTNSIEVAKNFGWLNLGVYVEFAYVHIFFCINGNLFIILFQAIL